MLQYYRTLVRGNIFLSVRHWDSWKHNGTFIEIRVSKNSPRVSGRGGEKGLDQTHIYPMAY